MARSINKIVGDTLPTAGFLMLSGSAESTKYKPFGEIAAAAGGNRKQTAWCRSEVASPIRVAC